MKYRITNLYSYNSVVFMSTTNYDYSVFGVTQSFTDSPNCEGCSEMYRPNYTRVNPHGPVSEIQHTVLLQNLHQKAYEGRLERLENLDCMNAYARLIQSERRSLFLVFRDDDFPAQIPITFSEVSPVFWSWSVHFSDPVSYSWITPPPFKEKFEKLKSSPANWTVNYCEGPLCEDEWNASGPIQYCLSERIKPQCQIRWSMEIAIVVVLLNFLKGLLMFYTVFGIKEEPLLTMGDAVASFLNTKDSKTADMCLASIDDLMAAKKRGFNIGARPCKGKKYKWSDAVSGPRLAWLFLL